MKVMSKKTPKTNQGWLNRYKTTFLTAVAVISLVIAICEAMKVRAADEIIEAAMERNQMLTLRLTRAEEKSQNKENMSAATVHSQIVANESNHY
jgi:hypothetical protein